MHKILENRDLGSAFVLKVERNGLQFKAGQHVDLQILDSPYKRPYSIYSGENDDYLEFLIKEIPGGDLSPVMRKLKPDNYLDISEPEGTFIIEPEDLKKQFYFICTGTGIAPFHSIIKTYPDLNHLIIHGVKTKKEQYEYTDYGMFEYISCLSQEAGKRRVTTFIDGFKKFLNSEALFYLCGKGQMIYDVDKLLTEKDVPSKNILWEVYHAERI